MEPCRSPYQGYRASRSPKALDLWPDWWKAQMDFFPLWLASLGFKLAASLIASLSFLDLLLHWSLMRLPTWIDPPLLLDFDSTLGFPGEGPNPCLLVFWILVGSGSVVAVGVSHGDAARPLQRQGVELPGRVTAATASVRATLMAAFNKWLRDSGLCYDAIFQTNPLDLNSVLSNYGSFFILRREARLPLCWDYKLSQCKKAAAPEISATGMGSMRNLDVLWTRRASSSDARSSVTCCAVSVYVFVLGLHSRSCYLCNVLGNAASYWWAPQCKTIRHSFSTGCAFLHWLCPA